MLSTTDYATYIKSAPFDPGLGKQLDRVKNLLVAVYDFTVYGGAAGSYALKDLNGNPAIIPANAIVTRTYIDSPTACTTSNSGTLAFQMANANDLKTATAAATFTGIIEGAQTGVASAMTQNGTTDKQVTAVIANALTAGHVYLFVEYVLSSAT